MTQAQNVAELSSDINSSGVLQPVGGGTGLTSFTAGTNYVAPGGALGTPSSGTLTNCTFPTLNQNTTGTAAGLSATLAIASGGTNSTATATAGGVGYGTGTAHAYTTAGTSGQVLQSNGSSAPSWATPAGITSGTTVASTSGTSITFTGIPSSAKRITIMFNGTATNGGSGISVQIGAGSIDTAATYTGVSQRSNGGGNGWTQNSTYFTLTTTGTYDNTPMAGSAVLNTLGSNIWVLNSTNGYVGQNQVVWSGGAKTLSGTLDRVRIITSNGSDTFNAGSINILYE